MHQATFFAFSIAVTLSVALAMPAFSQNRFMDEAKERAERLKENNAIRQAEHPEAIQATTAPNSPASTEATQPQAVPVPEPAKTDLTKP
jgi:hypothetical protein